MLDELKAAELLRGFRGAAKADIAALTRLIAQVSLLAARLRDEVSEIELNPVLVHPEGQGVTIVDALVVRRSEIVGGKGHLAPRPPEPLVAGRSGLE